VSGFNHTFARTGPITVTGCVNLSLVKVSTSGRASMGRWS
jgi:hypothetical protein